MAPQNSSSRGRHTSSSKTNNRDTGSSAPKRKYTKRVEEDGRSFSKPRTSDSTAPKRKYTKRDSGDSRIFSKTNKIDTTAPKRKYTKKEYDEPKNYSGDSRGFSSNDENPKRTYKDREATGDASNRVVKYRNTERKKEVIKKINPTQNKFSKNDTSKKSSTSKQKSSDATVRLNKYISNAGICSRREADMYIKAGNVTVNGKVVTEMGYQVMSNDLVKFDDNSINPEIKRYVLLNKPKDYITTVEDERGRKTVMDLVFNACKERIYPVGRLDRNTTGLLLFTNDGDLAKKLTHPKHNIHKLYHITLDKKLIAADLKKISDPKFEVEDLPVYVDNISYVEGSPKNEIGVEIHSGRNRIVRKIFESLGYTVVKLDRVIFAGLTKKDLPKGRWRHLTEQEVINLKMIK